MQGTCLSCGMYVGEHTGTCPKCDNELALQHDGSTVTVDIAHNGERVSDALVKMQEEIDHARKCFALRLRLIVGTGTIRDEVMLALRDLEFRGEIASFDAEGRNAGAVLVELV